MDDLHPAANVAKMSRGEPLDDADRWPWLEAIRDRIRTLSEAGRSAVLACSALKASYRDILLAGGPGVRLVYLKGGPALIHERLEGRSDHFFDPALLSSQFEALEEPEDVVAVDVAGSPDAVVTEIIARLGLDDDVGPPAGVTPG